MGLCFRCDKKYSLTHHCKFCQLQVLLGNPDEEDEEEEGGEIGQLRDEGQFMALSLNAIAGLNSPKTMNMVGQIGGQDVIVG